MITIYTMPGCMSCKKTKNYLKENQVDFEEKNIYVTLLIEEEIKKVIQFFYGKEEKYVTLSPAFEATLKKSFKKRTWKEKIRFLQKNPSCLKRPLFVYDEEGDEKIVQLLEEKRDEWCKEDCSNALLCKEARKKEGEAPSTS
ncbi:glutaredoxin domain-containing protein [Dubosiella newyorkensis]|uniref:Glutaredoxin domain-containing protein n=1 Tax=Dubosiella newyorkensis TaxID=1862672 RepID=A0A1U7NM24_9FIRM|nr:glutaredoxin domain-containing protein [Dubosiella newyorkensis]OLU46093.1 hypothetical protein BO225_07245 [Dubosiella newyorkensis]